MCRAGILHARRPVREAGGDTIMAILKMPIEIAHKRSPAPPAKHAVMTGGQVSDMLSPSKYMDARIIGARPLTGRITEYLIGAADGATLPAGEAGSHVELRFGGP